MVLSLKQNNMYSYDVRVCISTKKTLMSRARPQVWGSRHFNFFNSYLAALRSTLGYYRGDSLTYLMLITAFLQFWPKGHWEPHYEIGSLSLVRCLVGFELGIFQLFFLFVFNWDSLHARLNSHYEAWSYKKRSTKKITGYRKSV